MDGVHIYIYSLHAKGRRDIGRGCRRSRLEGGRQRCVEIIKPVDLWPFHEFARYLLGSSVVPLVFSSVSDIRRIRRLKPISLSLSFSLSPPLKVQSPEVGVQRSTVFHLHPLISFALDTLCPSHFLPLSFCLSFPTPPHHSSAYTPCSTSVSYSSSLSSSSSSSVSSPASTYLPLSTALLSGAAPSRVHPIPGFN